MSIQEKRRAAFEAWAAKNAGRLEKNEDGEYADSVVYGAWIGYNSALDGLGVELPDVRKAKDIAYFEADVRDAIESAGVRVKP